MRFKLVLLLTVMIASLSIQGLAANCGTNWLGNDAVGNDPDFNVAAREQGYTPSSASPAQVSPKAKVAPDERGSSIPKSEPNMDMPDPTPKPLGSSALNVSWDDPASSTSSGAAPAEAASADTSSSESAPSASGSSTAASKITDVSGKWSVDLGDSSGNYMDLVLIQSGKTIMGSGSLVESGTKIPLTMSGILDGDSFDLDAKSVVADYVNKINREYKMSLSTTGGILSGSYEAYASGALMGTGNVTARRP